jgi:hypothetical protein
VQPVHSFLVTRRGDGEVLVMDWGSTMAMMVLPVAMVWDQRADVSRQTRISSIGGVRGFAVFGQRTPVRGQGRNEGVLHPLRIGKAKESVNRPANS